MPKKYNWNLLLEKSWKITKILFALIVFGVLCYGYGTFKPNSHAVVKINAELDKFYMNKKHVAGTTGKSKCPDTIFSTPP